MKYAEYDEDGRIGGFYTLPEWEVDSNPFYRNMNLAVIEELDEDVIPPTHYVKDGKITTRPTMPLSIVDNRIFNVPVGAKLRIAEQTFEINDTVAEISGYHGTIKITCWPYRDAEVEI